MYYFAHVVAFDFRQGLMGCAHVVTLGKSIPHRQSYVCWQLVFEFNCYSLAIQCEEVAQCMGVSPASVGLA